MRRRLRLILSLDLRYRHLEYLFSQVHKVLCGLAIIGLAGLRFWHGGFAGMRGCSQRTKGMPERLEVQAF
jgi:hypothetical protein